MAKRRTNQNSRSSKTSWYKTGGLLSFWAIIISGTVSIVNLIMSKFGGSVSLGTTVNKIISIMLLLGLIIPSYVFLNNARMPGSKFVWKIMYWVFVILLFVGVISIKLYH